MQDWIAGAMAVLGTVLVLGGFTVIILRAMEAGRVAAPGEGDAGLAGVGIGGDPDRTTVLQAGAGEGERTTVLHTGAGTTAAARTSVGSRLLAAVRRMPEADRLIAWGILLLVLGAVAAGAISFNLGANAGTQ
ncbi:hypothetical protein [Rhizomonospora bruguierae]|uniref:hypothetical protein n=1 Tax=Rhizomonospora bruguierae TaxID=1581705 RepID=UPI001BD162CC|nr:hypothetical protein [Micromonospora sp. NBRC 107566]